MMLEPNQRFCLVCCRFPQKGLTELLLRALKLVSCLRACESLSGRCFDGRVQDPKHDIPYAAEQGAVTSRLNEPAMSAEHLRQSLDAEVCHVLRNRGPRSLSEGVATDAGHVRGARSNVGKRSRHARCAQNRERLATTQ